MSSLFALIVVAMFIEAALSYVQTIYQKGLIQWQIVAGYIIGVIICFDTKLNFFEILGLHETWPIVGILATALVVCRGSNYLFEFYGQLASWRKQLSDSDKPQPVGAAKKSKKKTIHYIA